MTIMLTFSLKYFFTLLPRIYCDGPMASITWLGIVFVIIQRPAAGIIEPRQMDAMKRFAALMKKQGGRP